MTSEPNGIGRALSSGLRLSSDAAFEREKAAEAERADYRRRYWQKYSKRVRRVFGTVTPNEYAAIAVRAEATQDGEPSVWRQIWLESHAYVSGNTLPTAEIAEQQRELLAELRRIGNNINQLARLAHIRANREGGLSSAPEDGLGAEAIRQFERLEAQITQFDRESSISKQSSTKS